MSKWIDLGKGVFQYIHQIDQSTCLYDLDHLEIRYNYNTDMIKIINIDSKTVCDNITLGYIRTRDRLTYQEYTNLIIDQLDSILAGNKVNTEQILEDKTKEIAIKEIDKQIELSKGSITYLMPLEIEPTEIQEEENYIHMEYIPINLQGFKLSRLELQYKCNRCNSNRKVNIGKGLDLKNDSLEVFHCPKCHGTQKIETLFHLIITTGENRNNITKLETQDIFGVFVSGATFTGICSECSTLNRLETDHIYRCQCGTHLGIQTKQVKTGIYRLFPLKSIRKGGTPINQTMNILLKTTGTCKHYKKSTRIFIFPCCNERYPCDICHDVTETHKCILAKRMICGLCGTEQPVGPKCTMPTCNKSLVKITSQFWEGGKGNRNQMTMSKKDSKKYKTQRN
ncbi:hypothetical protein NEOKW01_0668 [Nematocida sp. AWRm80]|nr:hypothetical protein NEOKW01_0668 [Nematocida sp. AWRm80]